MFFLGAETLVDDANARSSSYLWFPYCFCAKLRYCSFHLHAFLIGDLDITPAPGCDLVSCADILACALPGGRALSLTPCHQRILRL